MSFYKKNQPAKFENLTLQFISNLTMLYYDYASKVGQDFRIFRIYKINTCGSVILLSFILSVLHFFMQNQKKTCSFN